MKHRYKHLELSGCLFQIYGWDYAQKKVYCIVVLNDQLRSEIVMVVRLQILLNKRH